MITLELTQEQAQIIRLALSNHYDNMEKYQRQITNKYTKFTPYTEEHRHQMEDVKDLTNIVNDSIISYLFDKLGASK